MKKTVVCYIPIFFFTLLITFCTKQTPGNENQIPGESYFDDRGHTEYIAGDYPVIISIPHGGYLTPNEIADRGCDCIVSRDSYTQEIGRSIIDYFHAQTGHYPHVIINLLDRVKMDPNREKAEGADGEPYRRTGLAELSRFY